MKNDKETFMTPGDTPEHENNFHIKERKELPGDFMEITELRNKDEKAWDSYILNSDSSTFYHQIGW
ncbi:MAG: hypothetical protein U9O85_05805, partial [Euryarchaeota archaeon]|nr:hypothetical protein [Euryarchaeota archaeon]